MIKKKYLLSPGPTPVPEEVLSTASEPLIHHRTSEFSDIFMEVTEGLKYVFETEQDVYVLTSSGTGAMEASVVNTLCAGDNVISINGGKFGERWGDICRSYGIKVKEINLEWGEPFTKVQLSNELKANPETKAVFTTLSETSSGSVYPIQGYGEAVDGTDAILVVDGISGLGATPCPMDEWKVDVMIAGSQKALMIPPGLAYISFSQKAWKHIENSTLPKFYFNAKKYKKSLGQRTPPYTPAISLVIQQKKALNIIRSIGLKGLFDHHRILGKSTRAAIQALGLELFSKIPGNVLTAVKVPTGIDGVQLIKTMQQKYNAYIAGGQGTYKGKIFRIAHLGYMGGFDIITALSALEMTLSELGYDFELGISIKAAEAILKEGWE